MSQENQSRQESTKGLELFLLLACLVIAWPALFLGVIARWQINRTTEPYPYWIGAGIVGVLSIMLLITRTNPYPVLLTVMNDLEPLVLHLSAPTISHFLRDAIPMWERSILVFPWLVLGLELFLPKNLQATLLAQERHHQVIQAHKSRRAARNARKAPNQINGKGVLGALIDNPND
jgi:hypothetical protein